MLIEDMDKQAETVVSILKVMANKHRLMVLCCLQGQALSVSELNQKIGLSQSALSQHLAILRQENLVTTRKVAQTVFYSLSSSQVAAIIGTLHDLYCVEPVSTR